MSNHMRSRLALLVIFLGYLGLGVLKSSFLAVFDGDGKIIIDEASPLQIGGVIQKTIHDPRWYLNVVIILLYVLYGIGLCQVGYKDKTITKLVFLIYMGLFTACFLLVGIDLLAGKELFGYSAARAIKNYIIQTPFIILVVIAGQFLFYQRMLFDYLYLKNKSS